MAFNAVTRTETLVPKLIIDPVHPPVVRGCTFKANNGVLEAGTIIAVDANRDYVAYDASASDTTKEPKGVLDEDIDTSKQTVGRVLLHGVAVRENVKTKAGAATQDDIDALAAAGVYAL